MLIPALALLALALVGCSPEAKPRGQWLIHVDTNAPVVGQLTEHPSWSDAAVDTVRIDVQGEEPFQVVAPELADWPVSFGVVPGASPPIVRVRVFRTIRAKPDPDGPVLVPDRAVAIDRVFQLSGDPSGVEHVEVLANLDCVGALPAFGANPTTCIDADHPMAPATAGVAAVSETPTATLAGSWPGLGPAPCLAAPSAVRVCIPGGYSVLGEPALVGVLNDTLAVDPSPRRPVQLTSFWIDRTEMTVGRLRMHAAELKNPLPRLRAATGIDQHCTWLGESESSNDDLPVNCVEWATASELCSLLGGRLPTEAEWEHAARGRGRGFRYPWGNETPTCCTTSAARGLFCPGSGPEPVGSHPSGACGGLGDESIDGVLDLGGSVEELVDGDILAYDADCWQSSGVPLDPRCEDPQLNVRGVRGGDFASGMGITAAPLRLLGQITTPWEGFRCVYEDSP